MNILTKEQLQELIETQQGTCISMYLPTFRAGKNVEQNPIRLKNLIQEVEKKLANLNFRELEIEQILEPARKLVDDFPFWKNQSDGLAIFIAENVFRFYRFPLDFETLSVVGKRFHLKPLLPMLSEDGRFYVLALSQNQVRLFQGTHYSVSELRLNQVPDSLAEALKYDDPERHLQYHSGSKASTGKVRFKPTFHGQGVTNKDLEKKNISRFFHKIDKGIHELLKNENAPLVLAGVDYLLPIYREANTHPYLIEEGIVGNPDEKSPDELHDEAWNLVKPIFLKNQEEAKEKYVALASKDSDKTANTLEQVVSDAYFSRIETLFVPIEKHVWGRFDPESKEVDIHDENRENNTDLIDLAAVRTLFNGGTVYAIESEKMPDDEETAAAILRY